MFLWRIGEKKFMRGTLFCWVHRFSSSSRHHEISVTEASVSKPESVIDPLKHDDYFGVKNLVTIKELYDARVHYGHTVGCRHHSMQPYIFGNRNGVDIINLEKTYEHLVGAMNFLSHMVYRGGLVLFIMRSHIHGHLVEKTAKACGEYAQTRVWNRDMFLATAKKGARLPDLCVFLSLLDGVNTQHIGITDCAKINIASIGIADTNANPSLVTYPVPGNDDSMPAIELYCRLFKTCVLKAKEKQKQDNADMKAFDQINEQ